MTTEESFEGLYTNEDILTTIADVQSVVRVEREILTRRHQEQARRSLLTPGEIIAVSEASTPDVLEHLLRLTEEGEHEADLVDVVMEEAKMFLAPYIGRVNPSEIYDLLYPRKKVNRSKRLELPQAIQKDIFIAQKYLFWRVNDSLYYVCKDANRGLIAAELEITHSTHVTGTLQVRNCDFCFHTKEANQVNLVSGYIKGTRRSSGIYICTNDSAECSFFAGVNNREHKPSEFLRYIKGEKSDFNVYE